MVSKTMTVALSYCSTSAAHQPLYFLFSTFIRGVDQRFWGRLAAG